MKRLCFIIITCLALIQFSTASAAAQSSLNSGRDEFKTLINDRQFTGKLDPSDTIVAIYRTKTGFTILTNKHKMHVDVVVDKTSKAGGAEFHLVFHDPVERAARHKGKDVSSQKDESTPTTKAKRSHKASTSSSPTDE